MATSAKGRNIRSHGKRLHAEVTPEPPPTGLTVGGMVQWYDNGWRFGRLRAIKGTLATVIHLGHNRRLSVKELSPYVR